MKMNKRINYLTPILLGVIMFSSNFLSTSLFGQELNNFAVWFIQSIFSFASGWITTNTLGWVHGGKVVFSVIVAVAFVSILLVALFHNYFGLNGLLTENFILYTLRNVMLGLMGVFGLTVSELLSLQRKYEIKAAEEKKFGTVENDNKAKAELLIDEAKLKAQKIIFEAEKKSNLIFEKKIKIEQQLKEFIQLEKELIAKYEKDI